MSIEAFNGSSAAYRSRYADGQYGSTVSTNRSATSGEPGDVNLDALVSGARPELNDLIGDHASGAARRHEARAKRGGRHGHSELRDLLQKVLADGTITPEEIAQLRQSISSTVQGGVAGGAETSGIPPCANGGIGAEPEPDPMGSDEPVTSADPSGPTGSDNPAGPEMPPEPASPVAGPVTPPAEEPVVPPAADPGSFSLGGTKVRIKGGSDADRAKTRGLFEQMYEKDPEFRKGVDAKAANGLEITIEDLEGSVAGRAIIGGNTISLDPAYIGDTTQYANTIAHELAHNLGLLHGDPLEAFAAHASAVVV